MGQVGRSNRNNILTRYFSAKNQYGNKKSIVFKDSIAKHHASFNIYQDGIEQAGSHKDRPYLSRTTRKDYQQWKPKTQAAQ